MDDRGVPDKDKTTEALTRDLQARAREEASNPSSFNRARIRSIVNTLDVRLDHKEETEFGGCSWCGSADIKPGCTMCDPDTTIDQVRAELINVQKMWVQWEGRARSAEASRDQLQKNWQQLRALLGIRN